MGTTTELDSIKRLLKGIRASVYFEVDESTASEFKVLPYQVIHNARLSDSLTNKHSKLLTLSTRVWVESDSGKVRYIKNRYNSVSEAVDMKEFFWIKMRSAVIPD